MKLKREDVLKKMIIIYLIVFPIFDLCFFYSHVTTLIRIAILLFFVFLTVMFVPKSRKDLWWLFLYYSAMAVFLAIDYLHAAGFISLVPGDLNYSIVSEASTILKLSMPFTVLFILKHNKLSKKEFLIVINSWIVLVAGSIVISNVCGYSLSTYTGGITSIRIFDWWRDVNVEASATKGFFMYANQTTIILLILLIISAYETLFVNKKCAILTILVGLALIMVGSRISTLGGLASIIFIIISYLLFSIIKRSKISKNVFFLVGVVICWCLLLPVCPNSDRMETLYDKKEDNSQVTEATSSDLLQQELSNLDSDKFKEFEDNYNHVIFSDSFYKFFYPYDFDSEFWNDLVASDKKPTSYRAMEITIANRIWEVDSRWTDYLFGLSNARIQNVVNIEMDFVLQLYAFGIIGFLITMLFYFYGIYRTVKTFFKTRKFLDFCIMASFVIAIFAAFLSGNSLNFLAVIVPISFAVSQSGTISIEDAE